MCNLEDETISHITSCTGSPTTEAKEKIYINLRKSLLDILRKTYLNIKQSMVDNLLNKIIGRY
ncbi:hypothetical protein C1646_686055 [Rhizophagus diaphanus]|nr:hypothetical protein C1646_686055 [Rhizophagus diaphanus] [Rhizophagus sp. MUCL 43196]